MDAPETDVRTKDAVLLMDEMNVEEVAELDVQAS
jgi:hypothetical protein